MVPPVPIPNTVVKHINADGTWLATAWESRKLPVYMAVVVKWLTHWIVAPARVGSIPTDRPILQGYSSIGRATVSKTVGCEFDSYCPCHFVINMIWSSTQEAEEDGLLNR